MPLKKYDKKLDYSYTYGVFPTLDLLKHKKECILKVVLNSKGTRNEGYHELETACKKLNIPIEYDTKAILSISVKENTYALGVFKKFETELNSNTDHVVLVNPSNTGNIGTIIRTMAGLGFKDLALIKPAVDIFDPKVVRSSMGSLFTINFQYFDTFEKYLETTDKNRNLYTFMLGGTKNINDVKFNAPFSLIFGNESQGLENSFIKYGQSVYIPHNKDIDSLNLSIAVGIGLYLSSTQ